MENLTEFKSYKIGEAARLIGVKTHTLRFWEDEFDEVSPIRTEAGQRLYTEENMTVLREIKRLLYEDGLTIEGAKRKLNASEHGEILAEVRDELLKIKQLLSQ